VVRKADPLDENFRITVGLNLVNAAFLLRVLNGQARGFSLLSILSELPRKQGHNGQTTVKSCGRRVFAKIVLGVLQDSPILRFKAKGARHGLVFTVRNGMRGPTP